jgi:hypothetical protein
MHRSRAGCCRRRDRTGGRVRSRSGPTCSVCGGPTASVEPSGACAVSAGERAGDLSGQTFPRATIAFRSSSPPTLYAAVPPQSQRQRGDGRNGIQLRAPREPGSSGWRHHLCRNRPCCFPSLRDLASVTRNPAVPGRRASSEARGESWRPCARNGLRTRMRAGNAGVWFCNHTRLNPHQRWKPTRGLEPRTPSLRVTVGEAKVAGKGSLHAPRVPL